MGDEFFLRATELPRRRPRALRWVVMVPLVAVLALLIAPLLALPFGYRTMIVTGGSMEPVASAGDAVVVRATGEVAIGDVVTFRPLRSSGLVTHRVIDAREVGGVLHYRTQGDANGDPDPDLVPEANVVGRSVATAPGLGRVLAVVASSTGRIMLVVVPALVLAGAELWRLLARHRGRRLVAVPAVVGMVLLLAVPAGAVFEDSVSVGSSTLTTGVVEAPNLTGATADLLLCRITLTWTAPASGLAPDGYDVYRSTSSGGPFSFVKHVGTVGSTNDTGLARNTTYHYVLRSTHEGWTSVNSNQRSATTALLCV